MFGKSYYFTNNPGSSYNNNLPIIDLLTAFLAAPAAAATTALHGAVTPALINTTINIAGITSMMAQRKVQYLAGHKYVSSTEEYKANNIDELQDDVIKYHPF